MIKEDDVYRMSGPLLLLAGPGTGKTYQLAQRIKFLVDNKNVDPKNITVITFTAMAAMNMQERISDPTKDELYVSPEKRPKMICTMHSLGFRILREKASDLGLGEDIRVIYSDRLRDILMGDAAQLAGFSRNDGIEAAKCRQFGDCDPSNSRKCKICKEYRTIIRSCSAIDYDDQILLACALLRKEPRLLEKYRSYCNHLLVDEYQDINAGQFELISLLCDGQHVGLFVVGDDDQSIYSWRGGSPEFIRNFKQHFGDRAVIEPLQKSFRCHRHILEGAISVVNEYDKNRLPKGQFEYKIEPGRKIDIHNVPSDKKEATRVREIVERAIPSRSVLILLPHRGFFEAIIEELRKARIQYSAPPTIPGQGLPLVSTLSQWLTNNSDSLSFRECLQAFLDNPESGIPSRYSKKDTKVEKREIELSKISNLWKKVINTDVSSFWEALKLGKTSDELYSKVFSLFAQLNSLYVSQDDPASFIAELVKKLVPWKKTQELLEEINSWVETSSQLDGARQRSGVRLMTLQGAKGSEADVVCVVGFEEDIIPRSVSSEEELAEQSRLAFVSMTRAFEELHLFSARKRSAAIMLKPIYIKGKLPDLQPSRFINAIPDADKEIHFQPA